MIPEKELFDDTNGLEEFLKNGTEFEFDSTLCKILKELKFNYDTEGAYSKKVLVCRIEDNIDMIKKHCVNEAYAEVYFMMCFPAIAFITRLIEIPEDFTKKHDAKPWHLSLIRRTHFGLSRQNSEWSYTDSDCEIYLDDKRPYGNSDISGDIEEEYFKFNYDKELTYKGYKFKWSDDEEDHPDTVDLYDIKYGYSSDNEEFFWDIMDESNDIIKKMLKEIDYSYYKIINNDRGRAFSYYTEAWEICETSYTRRNREENLEILVGNE